MTDLEALYRAVLAHPDEDTPRLMYADEVQEADPARAEFIRTHIARANYIARGHGLTYRECPLTAGDPHDACPECWACLQLEFRAYHDLLRANAERWEPACGACGGKGTWRVTAKNVRVGDTVLAASAPATFRCPACKDTGRQPCRWERGFPVVEVAEMGQVWHAVGKNRPDLKSEFAPIWEPTRWLRDLLRTHHVAGVVPKLSQTVPPHERGITYSWEPSQLPPPVHRHCSEVYATRELAATKLARAVVLAALEWLDAQAAAMPVPLSDAK